MVGNILREQKIFLAKKLGPFIDPLVLQANNRLKPEVKQ